MRSRTRLAAAALMCLFIVGCGSSKPHAALVARTATPTASSSPTATSVPPAIPPTSAPATADILAARKCPTTQFASTSGDFSFTAITPAPLQFTLGYQLPPDIPVAQPYEVTAQPWQDRVIAPEPGNAMGYAITICNTGLTAHGITAFSAQVMSIQPVSGTTQDVGERCDVPYPPGGGGCGGACACSYNNFTVNWPGNVAIGTTSTSVTQTDVQRQMFETSNGYVSGVVWDRLPITLLPGQGYAMNLYTPQLPAGTYTFTIGIQTEAGAAQSGSTFPVFFAPKGLFWAGKYCGNNTAMQAQMQPGKLYLCPMNSP